MRRGLNMRVVVYNCAVCVPMDGCVCGGFVCSVLRLSVLALAYMCEISLCVLSQVEVCSLWTCSTPCALNLEFLSGVAQVRSYTRPGNIAAILLLLPNASAPVCLMEPAC